MSKSESNPPKSFEVAIGKPFRLKFEIIENNSEQKSEPVTNDESEVKYKLTKVYIKSFKKWTIASFMITSTYWALEASETIDKLLEIISKLLS